MNLQNLVDKARFRDSAVAELCKAIDELDAPALERVLLYVVDRREAFGHGDPRIRIVSDDVQAILAKSRHKANEKKTARKPRKPNAQLIALSKKAAAATTSRGADVMKALRDDPKAGITAKEIAARTEMTLSGVYGQLKKLGAYSNDMGLWWPDRKTYLERFPIAGKKKKAAAKTANGAATSP